MKTRDEALEDIAFMAQEALDRGRAMVENGLDPLEAASRVVASSDGRVVAGIALLALTSGIATPRAPGIQSGGGDRFN